MDLRVEQEKVAHLVGLRVHAGVLVATRPHLLPLQRC